MIYFAEFVNLVISTTVPHWQSLYVFYGTSNYLVYASDRCIFVHSI